MSFPEYYGNEKIIYQGNPEYSQNGQEINSIGSEIYPSNSGRNFNQTDNQLQNPNNFNNTERPQGSTNNNFSNKNNEINSLNSPNSNNMNYNQNFDDNNNFNNSNGNGINTQKQFYYTDGQYSTINNNQNNNNAGMYTNYNFQNNQNMNYKLPNQVNQNTKKQLESLIENLYDYYYRTKGFFQNDPNELIKFYEEYKKKYNKGIRVTECIRELMHFQEEDVKQCINEYIYNLKDRIRNASTTYKSKGTKSNFFKSASFSKTGETNIINKYHPKFTNQTLKRLYPRQEEIEKREKEKLNCDNFYSFFQKLLNYYQKQRGNLTNDKDEIITFWKEIPNKEKLGLQWENGEKDLIEEIELFFNDEEIIQRLSDIFFRHTKFRTYHPTPLHNFWEHDLNSFDRYYNGLNKYSKDDLFSLLEKYYKQMESEEKEKKNKFENDQKERERIERLEKHRELLEKEEEREKRIEELAIPKDRYVTGRAMLRLKDKFKYDNIIQKMIKNEFKDNKLFKYPDEYAIRDEDEQKLVLLKHQSSQKNKEAEEKIKEQIGKVYDDDIYEQDKRRPIKEKRIQEKKALFYFIKKKVIEYYKKMSKRLDKDKDGIESINIFLNNMYKEMSRKHRNATKLYFKKPRCEVLKKTYKFKKNHTFYPRKLKYYFFRLLRRIGIKDGKITFAKIDNLPFWGPTLSNNCKIHGNNCPIYCCYNTHNEMIRENRDKNFNKNFNIKNYKKKLEEKETLNLWKRPDVKKEKEKIFMCFEDAEHCTFEPKLTKNINENLEKDKLINSRLNNMEWVNNLKIDTILKQGKVKRAKIAFENGNYTEFDNLLKNCFDFKQIEEAKKKELERDKKDKKEKKNDKNEKRDKNQQITDEAYMMNKEIGRYRMRQTNQSKKLEKELDMIKYKKQYSNNKRVTSKEIISDPKYSDKDPQYIFVKEKYFNCKDKMCPLKDRCPNLRPNNKTPCKYAHQISELKFTQQINENIKLRENLKKNLETKKDPKIEKVWSHTGPLVGCNGCGKEVCNFCRYNKRNDAQFEKYNQATKKKNEKILKKIGYTGFQY